MTSTSPQVASSPRRHPGAIGLVLLACALLSGCFDADAMIASRREVAILARLEEVDLGKFRLTLPRPVQESDMAEIQFHAFGQVANRDLKQVTKALETHGPELRHRLLLAARQLDLHDIENARLDMLRNEIAEVINETLPGEPLQSVGFYKFAYHDF